MEKDTFKKTQKNNVFGWLWRNMVFFVKMAFWGKWANTICVWKVQKRRIFVETICFGKMVLFWCPFKVTKHYKNRGFSSHRGKPKMALLVANVPFWEGAWKGLYSLWYLKAVFCWKHDSYSVFSETQLCRNKRVQLEKQEKIPNTGGCLPTCKKVFFLFVFFVVWWFWFSLCVFFSLVGKTPKGYFPAILESFSLLSPKGLSLKSFFFLFCFLFWFSFCLPFQNSIFSLLFVHEPLFGKH